MYVLLSQYFYKVPHEWKKIIMISALFFVLIIINDQLKLNFDYKIIINSIILFLYLSLTILLGIIKKNEIEDLLGVIKLLKK